MEIEQLRLDLSGSKQPQPKPAETDLSKESLVPSSPSMQQSELREVALVSGAVVEVTNTEKHPTSSLYENRVGIIVSEIEELPKKVLVYLFKQDGMPPVERIIPRAVLVPLPELPHHLLTESLVDVIKDRDNLLVRISSIQSQTNETITKGIESSRSELEKALDRNDEVEKALDIAEWRIKELEEKLKKYQLEEKLRSHQK